MLTKIKNKIREYPAARYLIKRAQQTISSSWKAESYVGKVRECLDNIDLNWQPKKHAKPQSALIEITNACNINCLMCNTKFQSRPEGLMSAQVFERVITELMANGVDRAGLHTVGETFLYKDIATLIEIAKKHDFKVWLSTNAQYPQRMETLYRKFPKMITDIRVSTDGATKETFETIRVGGSFDKLIESLDIIHRINKGRKHYRIGLTIDSILNMNNIFEIRSYFDVFDKYVSSHDITFGLVTTLNSLNDGKKNDNYLYDSFPFNHLIRSTVPCSQPFTNSYFTYDGKMTLCCRDYNGEITAGDIMSSSLDELWDGEQAEKIRQQHTKPENLEIDACLNCFGPYEFISSTTNNFVHYLYLKVPELSPKEFGDVIYSFLEGMNKCMETQDINALKKFVMKAFDHVREKNVSFSSKHLEAQSLA
ncbi:MAG: radical SAM protein [Nitrospina sp.]|jgi:radical SAM protein with 4Fe4S-binding SPASM domain|nr:radical SAM protein [Nitrospina sp.]